MDVPGHRLYLDLSKITIKMEASSNTTINRDNWKILVCKATGKKWSDFTVTKGENHKLAKHAGNSEWVAL
jgi:hypothetical protein